MVISITFQRMEINVLELSFPPKPDFTFYSCFTRFIKRFHGVIYKLSVTLRYYVVFMFTDKE